MRACDSLRSIALREAMERLNKQMISGAYDFATLSPSPEPEYGRAHARARTHELAHTRAHCTCA
jgi:hypothetical protein